MSHDVFISYSHHDQAVADAVCATLEATKIRCWIAHRDMPAGKMYPGSLVEAIEGTASRRLSLRLSRMEKPTAVASYKRAGGPGDSGPPDGLRCSYFGSGSGGRA